MPLYSFGSNGNGQLGVGHATDLRTPVRCSLAVPDSSIAKITAGGNHSALLTTNGEIYFCGDNSQGQCADVTSNTFRRSQTLNERKWKDVACGWSFTILVDRTGQAFSLGEGNRGELGHDNKLFKTNSAVAIRGVEQIVSVACGYRHVIAQTIDGKAIGWGSNSSGQLGNVAYHDEKTKSVIPTVIFPSPVTAIACGQTHSVFLDEAGKIYTMGVNKYGQLGKFNPLECVRSDQPILGSLPAPAVKISCGWHHTIVLTDTREIWGWGRNDHGQLTDIEATGDGWLDKPFKLAWKPVHIPQASTIQDMICGSEHVLCLSGDTVYAWGWNEHGNCASTDADVFTPNAVPLVNPRMVAAGCSTSWVIAD
ncbi:regulator of chromosome condensation 1/beta-lactamase-inhibitor protein II [Umbelopsis sp. PMI_123]|nr:regulator of chromosome condensation 1/beta-lactamase-inhibitor protein II [Umbelopsis sp. PMI_123]